MKYDVYDKVVFSNVILSKPRKSPMLQQLIDNHSYFTIISVDLLGVTYPYGIEEDGQGSFWSESAFDPYIEPIELPEELFTL